MADPKMDEDLRIPASIDEVLKAVLKPRRPPKQD